MNNKTSRGDLLIIEERMKANATGTMSVGDGAGDSFQVLRD